jgi:hypothetical protein
MSNLTLKESALLAAIAEGMDEAGSGWLHELAPQTLATNAVLGSLIKKGLVHSHKEPGNFPGMPPAYWVELTAEGEALAQATPEAAPAPEPQAQALQALAAWQPAPETVAGMAQAIRQAQGLPPRPTLPGEALPPEPLAQAGPAPVLPVLQAQAWQASPATAADLPPVARADWMLAPWAGQPLPELRAWHPAA